MRRIEMKDDPLYKVLQIYSNDFMSMATHGFIVNLLSAYVHRFIQ